MTTRRSSFDAGRVRPFIRNLLHRCRGLIAFYTVLLFFSLPVPFGVTVYNAHRRWAALTATTKTWAELIANNTAAASHVYNAFSAVFFTALAAVIPLILSVTLYGYMQDRRAVDVYHSLPLTRQELFLGAAIAAAIILWAPLAAAFALTGMIAVLPGMSVWLVLKDLFFWAAAMLAIFAIASFCATQVGTVQDQLLFTLVVSVSGAGVAVLLNLLAEAQIYGYTVSENFYNIAYRLCPFSLMVGRHLVTEQPYCLDSDLAALAWLIASAALLVVSAQLYARRKSEQAEVLGNMGPLQLYVRLIGTFGGSICLGALIWSFLDIPTSSKAILLCIAVGGLLVYPIGDAVLARRVRRLREMLPVGLLSVAVTLLLCAAAMFDVLGYAERVPAPEQIQSVSIEGVETRYVSQLRRGEAALSDPASIETVLAAHRAQIAHGDRENQGYSPKQLYLTYTLQNGRTMRRSYRILCAEAEAALAPLETNDEVLRATAAVFWTTPERLNRVAVTDMLDGEEAELDLNEAQEQALLEALRADLLAQPQSELESGGTPLAVLRLEVSYKLQNGTIVPVPTVKPTAAAEYDPDTVYSDCTYLVTERFTETRRFLEGFEEVRSRGIGDGSLAEIESAALWLSPDWMRWGSNLYYSAGSVDNLGEIVYYYRDYEGDKFEKSPAVMVAKEEIAALPRRAYCPNRGEKLAETVAVLYYRAGADPKFDVPCGLSFARLSELSPALQEKALAAYVANHGDEPTVVYG